MAKHDKTIKNIGISWRFMGEYFWEMSECHGGNTMGFNQPIPTIVSGIPSTGMTSTNDQPLQPGHCLELRQALTFRCSRNMGKWTSKAPVLWKIWGIRETPGVKNTQHWLWVRHNGEEMRSASIAWMLSSFPFIAFSDPVLSMHWFRGKS